MSIQIIAVLIGAVLAVLQYQHNFILKDLRDRIIRMEDFFMQHQWTGEERRGKPRQVRTGDPIDG